MSIQSDINDYFPGVEFVISATFEEKHMLWLTRHEHDLQLGHIHRWEDEGMGRCPTIAYQGTGRNRRPICLSIFYAHLDGLKVAFYDATSELVDYKVVHDWIEARTKHIKYDNGTRWAHEDAGNFHTVIHEIDDRRRKRLRGF
jgi:predicted ArsR family transcriptional regulator